MGSPQEREAILWGKKSWSKAGQKLDKRWSKDGQKQVILGEFCTLNRRIAFAE